MRPRAAADTEIADVEGESFLPELCDLVAVAEERIQRGGEGAVAGKGRVRQALKDGLRRRRPVGNRQRGHVTRDVGAALPEQWHRRVGAPGAPACVTSTRGDRRCWCCRCPRPGGCPCSARPSWRCEAPCD